MVLLWVCATGGLGSAWAAPPVDDGYGGDPTVPLGYSLERAAPAPDRTPKARRGIALRLHRLSMPKRVLDAWFNDETVPGWPYSEPRPDLRAVAVGLEYVFRGPRSNFSIYAEYVDPASFEGYWDRRSDPEDLFDGRYLLPRDGTSLVGAGLVYAYAIPVVGSARTHGVVGVDVLLRGGLGVAGLLGELERWGPDDQGNSGFDRFAQGFPSDRGLGPRVFPIFDLGPSLRATFGDVFVVQFDVGMHSSLAYGASVGVVF